MSLLVYEMPHSPYCIPITHALECFGVSFERANVPNWDRREVAEVTSGQYYQVPVLVHGKRIVFETTEDPLAVAHYIDEALLGGRLFPAEWTGLQDLIVDHLENELEGFSFKLTDIHLTPTIEDVGERTMVVRHKERAFGRGCLDDWRANAEGLRAELVSHLAVFDQRLQHEPFLFGETPIYADFALFGIVGNYTYRGYNRLPARLEALADWHVRLTSWRPPS